MGSLKEIRKRIRGVKGTQKITQAMKMISSAKLYRAHQDAVKHRKYTQEMRMTLFRVASRMSRGIHPLLEHRETVKKMDMIVFTSDRGLCGSFNGSLLRRMEAHLRENPYNCEQVDTTIVGHKGYEFFKARNIPYESVMMDLYRDFTKERAMVMARRFIKRFLSGEYDGTLIAYNKCISTVQQESSFDYLLPLQVEDVSGNRFDYIYGSVPAKTLEKLAVEVIAAQIYQAYLETIASEHAARFTAMDGAVINASQMLNVLGLEYNHMRQSAITRELMDIVGGAEAQC
ncbi:ATP synthase F1 subunit gamma [bacterium]|nr:ATP synthase F1 subunit gamma [bacterium]